MRMSRSPCRSKCSRRARTLSRDRLERFDFAMLPALVSDAALLVRLGSKLLSEPTIKFIRDGRPGRHKVEVLVRRIDEEVMLALDHRTGHFQDSGSGRIDPSIANRLCLGRRWRLAPGGGKRGRIDADNQGVVEAHPDG